VPGAVMKAEIRLKCIIHPLHRTALAGVGRRELLGRRGGKSSAGVPQQTRRSQIGAARSRRKSSIVVKRRGEWRSDSVGLYNAQRHTHARFAIYMRVITNMPYDQALASCSSRQHWTRTRLDHQCFNQRCWYCYLQFPRVCGPAVLVLVCITSTWCPLSGDCVRHA
jgi:hypothetical protein